MEKKMPVNMPDMSGGNIIYDIRLPDTIVNGQKTVSSAGTAEALGASTSLESGIKIKALADNTGTIYVGDSDVDSSSGFELAAGEEVFIEIDDLAKVYVDASSSGDGVSYIGA